MILRFTLKSILRQKFKMLLILLLLSAVSAVLFAGLSMRSVSEEALLRADEQFVTRGSLAYGKDNMERITEIAATNSSRNDGTRLLSGFPPKKIEFLSNRKLQDLLSSEYIANAGNRYCMPIAADLMNISSGEDSSTWWMGYYGHSVFVGKVTEVVGLKLSEQDGLLRMFKGGYPFDYLYIIAVESLHTIKGFEKERYLIYRLSYSEDSASESEYLEHNYRVGQSYIFGTTYFSATPGFLTSRYNNIPESILRYADTAVDLMDIAGFSFELGIAGYEDRLAEHPEVKRYAEVADYMYAWMPPASMSPHHFEALVTKDLNMIKEFHEGKYFISSGRKFTKEEYENGDRVAIISESVAVKNSLKPGDTIKLSLYEEDEFLDRNFYEYTIVGIYKKPSWQVETTDLTSYQPKNKMAYGQEYIMFTVNTASNHIFIPFGSAVGVPEFRDYYDNGLWYDASDPEKISHAPDFSFTLKKNSYIDDFLEEMKPLTDSGYVISYYDQGYSGIRNSLTEMRRSSLVMLISTMFGAGAIEAFAIYILIVTRKRDMTIMLAMGTPRGKVFASFFLSLILIFAMATGIGLAAGGYAAGSMVKSYSAELYTEPEFPQFRQAPWVAGVAETDFDIGPEVLIQAAAAAFVMLLISSAGVLIQIKSIEPIDAFTKL